MAEANKSHLEHYIQARERVLKGGDWLSEYLILMHDLALAGCTPTELNEISSLWAEIYRKKVEEIYPQHKNLKLVTGKQYGIASDDEKESMVKQLFIHKLIHEHIRHKRSKAIAEWIIILIGATFCVFLFVYIDEIENLPTWILLVAVVVLFPILMFLGAFAFSAQVIAAEKIDGLLKAVKSFVGSTLTQRSNKKEEK